MKPVKRDQAIAKLIRDLIDDLIRAAFACIFEHVL